MNLTPTQKGICTGVLITLVLIFCFYVLKLPYNGKEQYVVYSIYLGGILWSLFAFKKTGTASKKFKDYFSIGFKTFIVVILFLVLYTFIFLSFNTTFRDTGITENNRLLLLEGNHTPAEIEANANRLKKIFMPMILGITTFKYLILGVLITAVGAGFLSSKNNS